MAMVMTARQKAQAARMVELTPARYAIDASILQLAQRGRDAMQAMHERNAQLEERLDLISSVLEEANSFLDELDSCSVRLAQRLGLEV